MGERCNQPNTYYAVGSGVYLFLWIFEVGGEICVPSANDYDPGAHLSFGDVRLDSTVDPRVAQVNIKASRQTLFVKRYLYFWEGQVVCCVLY